MAGLYAAPRRAAQAAASRLSSANLVPPSAPHIRSFSTVIDDKIAPILPSGVPAPAETSSGRAQGADGEHGRGRSALEEAQNARGARADWTKDEIREIYHTPLMELAFAAAQIHRRFHRPTAIQLCTLMNIKTGGCSEDCSYCAQSSRYSTGLQATKMSSVDTVLAAARNAKSNGSTRFCMGAAWRDMRGRKTSLKNIRAMVEGIKAMDMEVCVTLGMIDDAQAKELADAGLTAYNHNVDTSREHYPSVISTRTYDERLQTLRHVADAGINVCSGGILGLGEHDDDRVGLVHTVATLDRGHPESFPVNALVPIRGTPLGDREYARSKAQGNEDPSKKTVVPFPTMLRTIATARLVMPHTIVRIAAGRHAMSEEQQVLCFMAGANAVFTGEKMLTTSTYGWDEDKAMFARYGLVPMRSFERGGLRAEPEQPAERPGTARQFEAGSFASVRPATPADAPAL